MQDIFCCITGWLDCAWYFAHFVVPFIMDAYEKLYAYCNEGDTSVYIKDLERLIYGYDTLKIRRERYIVYCVRCVPLPCCVY